MLSALGAAAAAGALPPPCNAANTAFTSVPAGPMIANNESTDALSPSFKPTYNKVPEWKDSNSIVALSVSISAKISPSFTVSPTFLSQEATVPSVIVSLSRGIVTTSTPAGIAAPAAGAVATSATGFASSALGAVAGAPPPISAEISSPSLPMIAKSVSTLAPSPSCNPIYNKVPE